MYYSAPVPASLPLVTRVWFSLVCALRVLIDPVFAAQVFGLARGPAAAKALSDPPARATTASSSEPLPSSPSANRATTTSSSLGADLPPGPTTTTTPSVASASTEAALILLSGLQQEGRLVDFVEQDIDAFDDADVGAAARVLHRGCREVLRRWARIAPVRDEDEEARVRVEDGIDDGAVKLVGEVVGAAPFEGILRHRGWRVTLSLPTPVPGHDVSIVAPAEVEV